MQHQQSTSTSHVIHESLLHLFCGPWSLANTREVIGFSQDNKRIRVQLLSGKLINVFQPVKLETVLGQTVQSCLRNFRRVPFISENNEKMHMPDYTRSHIPRVAVYVPYCGLRALHSTKPAYILESYRHS